LTLREILARRETIRTELRSILDAAPDGNLGDEARTRADALQAEAERLNTHEARVAALDELDRRAAGTPLTGGTDDRFEALAGQVTALDVIRAQMGGTDAACGRAKEVSAELERRSGRRAEGLLFGLGVSGAPVERRVFSVTTPAGGPGSNVIQNTVSPNLIDRLRERVLVRQLGATVLSGLQGNLAIPRLKASATASWVAEGGAITASDPQTEQVSLSPKHVGGIVEISRNMVQQPSLDVARMVEGDLTQLIAVALDQVAIQGGGTNQPSGILASGSGVTVNYVSGGNGGGPTWDAIVALIAAVDTSNALGGSLAFLTNGKLVSKLRRTLKTGADTSSNFLMTDANTLAGYPIASTQNVPSNTTRGTGTNLSALIFGDFSQLIIGFWSELDILVNPYESTAYSKGNVQIRAMATADVKLRQSLAFAAQPDFVTT
jgi:HK97 family phage major capsid protein